MWLVSWSEVMVNQHARNITPVHTKRSEGSQCHDRLRDEGVYIHMELRWGGVKIILSNDLLNHAYSHKTRNIPEGESCANGHMTTRYGFVLCVLWGLLSALNTCFRTCVFKKMLYGCDSILSEALRLNTNAFLHTVPPQGTHVCV